MFVPVCYFHSILWVDKRPFSDQSIVGRWIMLKCGQWYVRNVLVEKEKGIYICCDDLINLHDGVVKLVVHSVSKCAVHILTEFCSATVSAGEISVKWDM